MQKLIYDSLHEAQDTLNKFILHPDTLSRMEEAAHIMADALKLGNKVISCGNGGSLCDATHFAEELTGRYRGNRRSLPAISINDPAYLTCVANDFNYNNVYSRYLQGLGQRGDVLLAITTSGLSENISLAMRQAREMGIKVILLTSDNGNALIPLADVALCAPRAPHSDRIQEIHIKIIHILIQAIEEILGFQRN